jgi:hypothetical protein
VDPVEDLVCWLLGHVEEPRYEMDAEKDAHKVKKSVSMCMEVIMVTRG